jgi:hypothetical protein
MLSLDFVKLRKNLAVSNLKCNRGSKNEPRKLV